MEVREASAAYAVTATPQVPKGYKQTEVGVIPEDWEVVTLLSLAGGAKERFDDGDWIEAEFLTESGIRLVQTGNIGVGVFIDKAAKKYISPASFELLRCKALKEGDLLICRLADPAGRACLLPKLEDDKVITAVDVTIFRPIDDLADRRYLLQLFGTRSWFAAVNERCGGSTRTRVARGALGKIQIPRPTKAEQEAIAEALSDADALIESLGQLLAKKRHLKQGAMQQLLTGKKRLPGFSKEWEMKRLGEVIEKFVGGGTPSRSNAQYWGNEIPWVTVKDFATFSPRQSQEAITRVGLQNSASHLISKGTLITSTRMALGKAVIYEVDVAINQDLKALFPKTDLATQYLYFWFQYHGQAIDDLGSGSTVKGVSLPDLKKIEFQLPSLPEQTAIATILSDIDAELAALEEKLTKARSLKQGMMQALLTGRIRLVQPTSNVMPFPEKAQPAANTGSHNKQINEAVIIGVLSKHFGTENFPLPRKRRVKLMYLLHRYAEGKAEGYLKKAAGPYDPSTKYKGPEAIAVKNGYVLEHHNGSYPGFVAGDKITQAESYFEKWYGADALAWLEQFKYKKTDELELLTTVDMAMVDLAGEGRTIDLPSVKSVIADHPEWVPKLSRETFSDANIERAIGVCSGLFG